MKTKRKQIKVSTSTSGMKTKMIAIDKETTALVLSSKTKERTIQKTEFKYLLSLAGMKIEHKEDIKYKRPFWKIFGTRSYTISVFKIK